MAPTCSQCVYFDLQAKHQGSCNFDPPHVEFNGEWVTAPRPVVQDDDVACSEFRGMQ